MNILQKFFNFKPQNKENKKSSPTSPLALIIIDGFGLRDQEHGNAVKAAHKPNFDRYWAEFPHQQLNASGEFVGLPAGQMGNSEVGHLNIGAGRIVYQSLELINNAIKDQTFFSNSVLMSAMTLARDSQKTLHLIGLLSDGGVHSHQNHLFNLLKMAAQNELKKVKIHVILDGRDAAPQSALNFLHQLETQIAELGVGEIATISGRYYAMDRDKRWERIKQAYDVIVNGDGEIFTDPEAGLEQSYSRGEFDEFVKPFAIGQPSKVDDDDVVIFYNFRPDRAAQLSMALANADFNQFETVSRPKLAKFVSFTKYNDDLNAEIAFAQSDIKNTLGEVLSNHQKRQLRIAETEKYPHVTFFMNGGRHEPFTGEDRILIPSPKVATYDLQPEMSVFELKNQLLERLRQQRDDVIILNFANADMVGHSGKMEPTIKAIEAVDQCLGEIVDQILELGGCALITADHGNSEHVLNDDETPMTAHTSNPVPLIVTKRGLKLRSDGNLADLAPTILALMNIDQPNEMTGHSLILKDSE
ncbi:MAG: 2,3-bisphosphoglycerate-independent phosphoglycerate mutase [Candidatus Saccharibacteria bacterium]|nr:2,3-bisphosphoglycerate-independent phosphoglycerate mutase [Candidatus Saccharibacteria bacterium]